MNRKYIKQTIVRIIISIFFLLTIALICYYTKAVQQGQEIQRLKIQHLQLTHSKSLPKSVETITQENIYNQTISELQVKMDELDSNVFDRKKWFVGYKQIIDEYKDIIDPPETIYDYYNEDELDMLFRVVQAEIGDEYSFEQKCNVASVIFNRIAHDRFENEMLKVLTADQFSTISNGRYKEVEVSEETILACEYVFMIGDTTGGCLFFDSNEALRYEFVFFDGAHNFYKIKGE